MDHPRGRGFKLAIEWQRIRAVEGTTPWKVNTELLQGVIKDVEDYLKEGKLLLDPEPKARLVAILYDRFDVADQDVDPRIVSDYLKLVA